jgi:hypothetical protein
MPSTTITDVELRSLQISSSHHSKGVRNTVKGALIELKSELFDLKDQSVGVFSHGRQAAVDRSRNSNLKEGQIEMTKGGLSDSWCWCPDELATESSEVPQLPNQNDRLAGGWVLDTEPSRMIIPSHYKGTDAESQFNRLSFGSKSCIDRVPRDDTPLSLGNENQEKEITSTSIRHSRRGTFGGEEKLTKTGYSFYHFLSFFFFSFFFFLFLFSVSFFCFFFLFLFIIFFFLKKTFIQRK